MRKLLLLFFLIFAILVAGCFQSGEMENKGDEGINQSKANANQSLKSKVGASAVELAERIKSNPEEYLIPYNGFSYTEVNVSVEGERIVVKARSEDLPGKDIYLFVVDNGTLTLKSYLLEALPLRVKEKAISVALSNETVYKNAEGYVTVRRVLPHTAAKFYLPKEMFSVTWHGDRVVSALVDLDEERVVRVFIS